MKDFVAQQENFVKRLIDVLKTKFTKELEFDYQMIIKTNDLCRPALIVREPKKEVGKTIYLEEAMKKHMVEGVDIDDLAEDIVSFYETKSEFEELTALYLIEQMKNFEYLLDGHITLKLINRSMNERFLQGKAYLEFLDLAIVFCMTLRDSDSGIGVIVIPKEFTRFWNISLREAFKKVLNVLERNYPITRTTLFEFMLRQIKNHSDELEEMHIHDFDVSKEMYIQTNQLNLNGSTTMLYRNNLAEFCEEKGIDEVYIIPSSIHEIILIPKFEEADEKYFKSIIREVNDTLLASDEILSNNLYIYNKNTDEITICND